MSLVVVATDGSAINNPHGPAGWAWFVSQDCWAAGGFQKASNQVAELFAVLAVVRAVPREHEILIRTDSQFTINSLSKWLPGWKRNGWRKADGGPVANLQLMQDLDRALAGRRVRFEWVRGHAGDPMNEIADRVCRAAAEAVRDGQPVLTGPGWTGYNAAPVVPRVTARPRTTQRPSGGGPALGVQATRPAPTPEICGSCDGAINPLTLHCRCGSL